MSERYGTDGMIVKNQQGDCMGIFSAVSLLNDKIQEIELLRTRLASAEEALALYANTGSWYRKSRSFVRNKISDGDIEDMSCGLPEAYGGKRARQHFEKYKESEKCTK